MRNLNTSELPSSLDIEQARVLNRTLSAYADAGRISVSVRGSNGNSDDLVLPDHVLEIFLGVLSEVSMGNAVSLVRQHQELSTQAAAELLDVSRPFLVGLLEKGEIAFRRVGSHRRVRLQDLLEYRRRNARARITAPDVR